MSKAIQKIQKIEQTVTLKTFDRFNQTSRGFPFVEGSGSHVVSAMGISHSSSAAKIPIRRRIKTDLKVKAGNQDNQTISGGTSEVDVLLPKIAKDDSIVTLSA